MTRYRTDRTLTDFYPRTQAVPMRTTWLHWIGVALIGLGGALTILATLAGMVMFLWWLEAMLKGLPRW